MTASLCDARGESRADRESANTATAILVVVTHREPSGLAEQFFSATAQLTSGDYEYRLYRCRHTTSFRHCDIDGTVIVEGHSFATEAAARRWVKKDARRRGSKGDW